MGKGNRIKKERREQQARQQAERSKKKSRIIEAAEAEKMASESSTASPRNIASRTPAMKPTTKEAQPDSESKGKGGKTTARKTGKPYKKGVLARTYDAIRPGDYTPEQDRKHTLALSLVIVLVIVTLGFSWFIILENQKQSVSAKLLIPSTTYTTGQLDNVVSSLEANGFKNIEVEDDGDVLAYGTQNMVDQYRTSYKEKHIDKISSYVTNDHSAIGVSNIDISQDRKTMTITTITDDPLDSSIMGEIARDVEISALVSEYGKWCRMVNDGEPMTIKFVNELTGETYYESQRQNADMIVADLEKLESDAEKNANADNSSTNEPETTAGNAEARENSVNDEER